MNNNQPLNPVPNPMPTYPGQPISAPVYPTQPIPVPATSAQQIPISRQPQMARQPQTIRQNQVIRQPQPTNPIGQPARQATPQRLAKPRTVVGPQRPMTSLSGAIPSRPQGQPTPRPTATKSAISNSQAQPASQPSEPKISHIDTDSAIPFNNTVSSTIADPIQKTNSVSSKPVKPKKHIFRKIFITFLILAILGGLGYGFFFIKTTGDKIVTSFFNFTKTASNSMSVTIKGTLKITSQNDEPLPTKNNSLLDLITLGDTFSAAKMHFTYSSNANNLSSQLMLNLSDFGYSEQVSASSVNLNITNLDENGSYLKYNTNGEASDSVQNIASKLSSLGLQKDTWAKTNQLVNQDYFSIKSLLDLLKAKNITEATYQPDFFIFSFPTNRVKKVGNNLYQVVIDTMRLQWFLEKYDLLKINKPNLFDLPQIYVELDSTNRITRILIQGQYNYYNVTLNIYDIIFSSDPLKIEAPTEYIDLTPEDSESPENPEITE